MLDLQAGWLESGVFTGSPGRLSVDQALARLVALLALSNLVVIDDGLRVIAASGMRQGACTHLSGSALGSGRDYFSYRIVTLFASLYFRNQAASQCYWINV